MTYEELKATRQGHFRRQVEKLGNKEVAMRLGCRASYVSQLVSGARPITERTARYAESMLGLKPKSLDQVPR